MNASGTKYQFRGTTHFTPCRRESLLNSNKFTADDGATGFHY